MQTTFRFGRVEVELDERLVLVDGKPVALGGRAFDLLGALIARPGKLVSKDELLDIVWGRIVVEEANLHVHVSALRKILGPDAIATVPGRGYRFTLAADEAAAMDAAAPVAKPAPRAQARPAAALAGPPELVGREDDLAALLGLLDNQRLVTVAGPGGIGKTRLARAIQWAARDRYAEGVTLVELAPLTNPALIPGAIAAALQLPLAASGDALAAMAAAVRPLGMLLVLDNAEHLVEGVARVAETLLAGDSAVQLLVTSQIPLRIAGEQLYRLGGLAVPPADAPASNVSEALAHGAIALFDARVRAVDRSFRLTPANLDAVVTICSRLDGVALAIELAAARVPLLGLQTVALHLDANLRHLRSGNRTAPDRQQTLQAAMDWSHGLLGADQQAVFRQLGVFAGGFTVALARQALQLPGKDEWDCIDMVAELVDRSLVQADGSDTPRYRLFETGRAYALQKLAAAGELDAAKARHAASIRALFEAAWEDCWLIPEAEFIARYEPELDNLRAALDWALQQAPETAIALTGAASRLWRWLSLHPEGLRRCAQAEALVGPATPKPLAARLLEASAQLAGEISNADSRRAAEAAERLYAELGDRRGQYLALAHLAFSFRSATPEAEAAATRMRRLEDPAWPPAVRLYGTKVAGGLAFDAGRIAEAREATETRLALARAIGSERDVNAALGNLADIALITGNAGEAVERGRALLANLGRRQVATRAIALGNLMLAQLAAGDLAEAREALAEFVGVARQLNYMFVMYAADAMALLAAREGRWEAGARLLGCADAAYTAQRQPREQNEAKARETAWALLLQHEGGKKPGPALRAALAAGAAMRPEAVCALAMEAPGPAFDTI